MDTDKQKSKKVSFKDTLNLPQTDFPIRPNAKKDDQLLLERWAKEDLYRQSYEKNSDEKKFVLHDGPPYANGPIHIGHAYNKILKDIITKAQRMLGKHVPVKPGWDCHGLPIELKVTQEHPGLSGAALKKECRAYAEKWINVQREGFKNLGVLMDWDNPYKTMDPQYEASIIRVFGHVVSQGYIERKNKTVPWCLSCKTVLASAEIEYHDRKDPSTYVLFPLEDSAIQSIAPELTGKNVSLAVWTTTPWTLPLNRAVLLKPHASYVVLDIDETYIILGEALAESLCAKLGIEKKIIATFSSDILENNEIQARHPLIDDFTIPVLLDNSVELSDGTACVHSAPGAGPIDYEIGVKNNLEIYSPIAADGTYTQEIQPQELVGMSVTDGQWWVLKKLKEKGLLLYKTNIKHSYPHCWRCRSGLIFRATKQWFFDLEKHAIKERALKATDTIATYPEKSINRFKATIANRLEWCLSRQRAWGVPIPALLCTMCDTPYVHKSFADMVASHVEKEGIEWWDTVPVETVAQNIICSSCNGTDFKKEKDILDVWLESGVSHYAVLEKYTELGVPADLYLEGSDQHRAWFQSSLLTSIALHDTAPMRSIFTHGFTVDEKGRKMSKSLGNVVAPQEVIDRLGTDGLRTWAASLDNAGDAVVSDALLKNVQEVYRKIRNTLRFLLSNLYDFDIKRDAIVLEKLPLLDQYALQELCAINYTVINAYNNFDITAVFHKLGDYCATDLSSFYLDIAKDRLYVEKADGHSRRSTQTVCWYILDTLTRLVAPILSFTAEQVSDCYQTNKKESIHLQQFAQLKNIFTLLAQQDVPDRSIIKEASQGTAGIIVTLQAIDLFVATSALQQQWESAFTLRSALLKAIEEQRELGLIKHPLEARVKLYIDPQGPHYDALAKFFARVEQSSQTVQDFLREFIIVSQFELVRSAEGLKPSALLDGIAIAVECAQGEKCPRCWQWDITEHEHKLCKRCQAVLQD